MLWGSLAAPPGESIVRKRRLFCSRRSSFSARCSSSTLTRSLRQHLLLWSARAHLAAAASAAQRAACRAAGRAFPHSCRTAVAQLHVVPAAPENSDKPENNSAITFATESSDGAMLRKEQEEEAGW